MNYQILVTNREQTFVVKQGELLLQAMEKACQQAINVGCRGGGCGLCKVKILQGRYQTKRMSKAHISAAEQASGFALACRVFPESDLVIESDHFEDQSKQTIQVSVVK
ncbi:ferredoxin [Nitrincola sp. A-D6]|nr:ferredoxin [Nitrincola sp. A-D6]